MKNILLILLCILSFPAIYAQDKPSGKFTGILFGDYFNKLDGDSTGSSSQYSQYNKSTQGFMIRRTRLHYEQYFNNDFTGNIGFESNDITKLDNRVSFIMYDANLEWKNVVTNSSLLFGLMPTPAFVWGCAEKMYGYRSVEKTISDKNGLESAVDIGVMMKGTLDKDGKYGYLLMIGNGKGLSPAVSKYLKYYASVSAKIFGNFIIEGFFDYQAGANDQYRYTVKGLAGYKSKHHEFTVEPVFQRRNNAVADAPVNPFGISVHTKYNLLRKTDVEESEIINVFARYDYFDPNSNIGSGGFKENFVSAGIDYVPLKNFHISPNMWMTFFKDKSPANLNRNSDIIGRVTFWFVY
jgi:hypothetical protein